VPAETTVFKRLASAKITRYNGKEEIPG